MVDEEGGRALREKPMFSKASGEGTDQYPAEEREGAVDAIGCGSSGSCDRRNQVSEGERNADRNAR